MNESDFKKLVKPFNMLIGYAQSAEDLGPEANIKKWGKRLVQIAKEAEKAWDEVIKTISTDEKTS